MKTTIEWHPQEMPSLLVNVLARLLSKLADEKLGAVGLTSSQLPVLASLKDNVQLTQKALAERSGVAQPSMAQLLARMERDGLIQRTLSASDKRISLISLTPQAEALLEPGRGVLKQIDEEACSGLTEEERQVLTELLLKLVSHVKDVVSE